MIRPVSSTDRFRGGAARLHVALTLAFAFALTAGACSRKIGDACTTSADCDPTGATRSCDLSQPGGYCVIQGCDPRSCPEDSFCVRFFPVSYSTEPCTATCSVEPCAPGSCLADEECVAATADEAFCVRRALERRICVQSCGGDGDCRGGYVCRPTGQAGAVALTLNPAGNPSFCRPAP